MVPSIVCAMEFVYTQSRELATPSLDQKSGFYPFTNQDYSTYMREEQNPPNSWDANHPKTKP